ncbi:MAG: J domain-containing protein [Halorientalis sp.]
MHHERLITGIAAVLAASAVVLAALALVYNVAILAIAAALGAAAYFMWYQASGRLAARVYRSVEHRAAAGRTGGRTHSRTEAGGFGAGPREEWTPPGDRQTAGGRGRTGGSRRDGAGATRQRSATAQGPSDADAYRVLGLEPGADEGAVRRAYRERVKEVHPDNGGDVETFKQVTRAYERLT